MRSSGWRAPTERAPGLRGLRRLAGALLLPLLAACSAPDDPAALFDDYNARLARVLESPLPPPAPVPAPAWPGARDLVLPVEDVRVGLRTFLKFDRCGLLHEISERNSGLGRVQPGSQRLLYEMRLLVGLRACVEETRTARDGDDEDARAFADTVHDVLAVKTRDLPRSWWNATVASPELGHFLSVAAPPWRLDEAPATDGALEALRQLAALGNVLEGAPPPVDAFEALYASLGAAPGGGRTWQGLALAIRELDRGSALLEAQVSRARLCPDGRPTPRAKRLHGVFDAMYVARVQPWLSVNAREATALAEVLESLWEVPAAAGGTAAAARYRAATTHGTQALLSRYTASVRRHALAWKSVLGPCGLAPRPPGGEV